MTTNEKVRAAFLKALKSQKMTQADLSEKLGIPKQNVSAYLTGERGQIPKVWEDMLDILGLEIVIKVKK